MTRVRFADAAVSDGRARGLRAPGMLALGLTMGLLLVGAASVAGATDDVQATALERLELAFLRSLYLEPGMLDVSLRQSSGSMILIGSVATEAGKVRAEQIAREALDAAVLRNRVQVRPLQPGHDATVADAILQARIEASIEASDTLREDRRRLVIAVEQGIVRLGGEVIGPARARVLVDRLRAVPGLIALDFRALAY